MLPLLRARLHASIDDLRALQGQAQFADAHQKFVTLSAGHVGIVGPFDVTAFFSFLHAAHPSSALRATSNYGLGATWLQAEKSFAKTVLARPAAGEPPGNTCYFFSSGQVLLSSGVKASSAGIVATSL